MKYNSPKMRSIKFLVATVTLLFSILSNGQTLQPTIFEDWTSSSGTQNFYQKSVTKTDASGNVYIAGATMNSNGNYDALVAKYSKTGTLIWINQYAGTGGDDDFASAIVIDASGNVYFTGGVINAAADSSNVLTVKYNSGGTQQWATAYHGGSGADYGADLTLDGSGNVYVTGSSNRGSTNKFDAVTLKYNSSGTQQWVSHYNYNNLQDAGYKITLDGSKVVVGAGAQSSSTDYRQAVVKYNSSTGSQTNATVSSSSGIGFAMVFAITTDATKNIYITGSKTNTGVGLDCYTVKYDSSLVVQWTATYNGSANGNDEAKSIALDGSGNVYITGYATVSGEGANYVTIKYNSGGTQQWVEFHNGVANGRDEATAIALDASGLPVVTGYVWTGVNNDYHTIKYDASGNVTWSIPWHNVQDNDDRAFDIAIAPDGSVIVVGQTGVSGALTYTTVHYTQKNAIYMPDGMLLSNPWAFVANRGQIIDTIGNHHDTLKYYNTETYPRAYFSNKSTSFVFVKRSDTITGSDTMARVTMTLKGANPDRLVRAFDQRADHYNFYGAGTPQGAVRVPLYKRLVSYDVYTKIDVEQTLNNDGLVTYMIVKPGGNPASIQMNYSGQTSLAINGSGDLEVSTAIGTMTMPEAYAFQIDGSGNYVSLAWQPTYNLNGDGVTFSNLGTYNSAYTLVFRIGNASPTPPNTATYANGNLYWSTFYGTYAENDYGMDVCNDNVGNSYVVGYTWDQTFPTWNSAATWGGGSTEGVVLKFDDGAEREWVTFYGGNDSAGGQGFDWIRSVVFNNGVSSNHLYFTGTSTSQSAGNIGATFPIIPATNPGNGSYWQNNNTYYQGVSYNAFIARMDTTFGAISWSTFFGGKGLEEGTVVKTAPNGRIFIVGNTRSSQADTSTCNAPASGYFPLCHSVQTSYFDYTFGGSQDAYLAYFDTTNTLRWCTYLGGGGFDDAYDATYDEVQNSIFVVGATDGSFPTMYQSSEYHMGTYSGQTTQKGFVSRFANNGSMEWSTRINRVKSIQTVTNISKEIIIVGITNSPDTAVVTDQDTSAGYAIYGTGYRDAIIDGNADYYVMNFGPQNQLRWSTFFGGGTDEQASYAVQINGEKNSLMLALIPLEMYSLAVLSTTMEVVDSQPKTNPLSIGNPPGQVVSKALLTSCYFAFEPIARWHGRLIAEEVIRPLHFLIWIMPLTLVLKFPIA